MKLRKVWIEKKQPAPVIFKWITHFQHPKHCVRILPLQREDCVVWHSQRHGNSRICLLPIILRSLVQSVLLYMRLAATCKQPVTSDCSSSSRMSIVPPKLDAFESAVVAWLWKAGRTNVGRHQQSERLEISFAYLSKASQQNVGYVFTSVRTWYRAQMKLLFLSTSR